MFHCSSKETEWVLIWLGEVGLVAHDFVHVLCSMNIICTTLQSKVNTNDVALIVYFSNNQYGIPHEFCTDTITMFVSMMDFSLREEWYYLIEHP